MGLSGTQFKRPKTKAEIIQKFLEKITEEGTDTKFTSVFEQLNILLIQDFHMIGRERANKYEKAALEKVKLEKWLVGEGPLNTSLPDFIWDKDLSFQNATTIFGKKKATVVLIDPHTGPINLGKFAGEVEAVKGSEAYTELMAQAKFYNGTLNNYTKDEQEYLKKWIADKGIDQMLQLLLNNILRARPEDQERFKTSLMQKLFAQAQK